jgi:hypothetical protein
MALDQEGSALRQVSLTEACNLSPLFDEAVREDHPVLIVRNRREWGVLLARDAMLRLLGSSTFRVNVIPEDGGGFTLWVEELEIGGHGRSLREARQDLLLVVRSYVRDYLEHFDFYRHLPDRARQEPYVLRLSLARDDAEFLDMLFPLAPPAPPPSVSQSVG